MCSSERSWHFLHLRSGRLAVAPSLLVSPTLLGNASIGSLLFPLFIFFPLFNIATQFSPSTVQCSSLSLLQQHHFKNTTTLVCSQVALLFLGPLVHLFGLRQPLLQVLSDVLQPAHQLLGLFVFCQLRDPILTSAYTTPTTLASLIAPFTRSCLFTTVHGRGLHFHCTSPYLKPVPTHRNYWRSCQTQRLSGPRWRGTYFPESN